MVLVVWQKHTSHDTPCRMKNCVGKNRGGYADQVKNSCKSLLIALKTFYLLDLNDLVCPAGLLRHYP